MLSNVQQRQSRRRRFVSWLKRFRSRPLRSSSTGSGSVLRPPAGSTRLTGLWGNFRISNMPWTNWTSAWLKWRMRACTLRNTAWSTVCWRTWKISWVQMKWVLSKCIFFIILFFVVSEIVAYTFSISCFRIVLQNVLMPDLILSLKWSPYKLEYVSFLFLGPFLL